MDNQNDILEGAKTAFINETYNPANDFKPKFLSNNFNHKVLNSIKDELQNCDEFFISSAFITLGGLTPLLAQKVDKWNEKQFRIWCDYHYSVCREQSVLGASNHVVIIGRK